MTGAAGAAGAAFNSPMQMGTDMRKRVSVSLELEVYARASEEARKRKTSNADREDLGPFLAWIVKRYLTLDFLCQENLEFLAGYLAHLGRPWTVFDLLDGIVSTYRKDVRAGKVKRPFWSGQVGRSVKSGAR